MNALALALRQVRYENTAFWRNPAAAFFTFVFPLMFLVIFNVVFGNREIDVPGGTVSASTFYVPGITALSVTSACYNNVAMGIVFSRDGGLLKRFRGTPLPAWSYLFGRIVHSVLVALLLVVIVTGAGALLYDVDVPTNTLPGFLLALAVGAATFCAIGLAVTAIIPNADAAPAIVNASILPLLFVSDVFIPLQDAPAWLTTFARRLSRKALSPVAAHLIQPVPDRRRLRVDAPADHVRVDGCRAADCSALLPVGAPPVGEWALILPRIQGERVTAITRMVRPAHHEREGEGGRLVASDVMRRRQ